MTANRPTQERAPDPPGVTYEGEAGVYTVRLHGRIVGTVTRGRKRHSQWTAYSLDRKNSWTGRIAGEAVQPLIAWDQAGRP